MSSPFDPYAEQHKNIQGPGDARPTALNIIEDEGLVNQWPDKVVVVTGATSGIGVETARALHATGARVFITARDAAKAERVVSDILRNSEGKGGMEVITMDMDSLDSVKAAARRILEVTDRVNVLVNNAGIMATPQSTTADGFERQFGVNHLAHFTLTALLLPTLLCSSTAAFKSRVINVSSSSHRYSTIHWADPNLTHGYDPFVAYGQSKTANIWTANYIDRVYGPRGVHALSLHPGGIWTGLQQYAGAEQIEKWKAAPEVARVMKTPAQGAATTVWAATARVWEGKGGKYLADCRVAPPARDLTSTMDDGVGPDAYDEEGENRLWELSSRLVGVQPPY